MTRHLTYANVVSSVCLFILLGGSAYAATQLSKNSVRSAHIKNGQVKSGDLGANAVSSSKVKNGSLRLVDFAANQLPQGAQGQKGDKGDKGDQGLTGPAGPSHGDGGALASRSTPPAVPGPLAQVATVNTVAGQRVFVYGHTDSQGACVAPNPCSMTYGLYVDDQPVPGSGRAFSANSGEKLGEYTQLAGMTAPLAAGAHKVSIGVTAPIGNPGTLSVFHEAAGGIAVGG